jgi:hypothetical protein
MPAPARGRQVRRVADVAGLKQADVLDFLIMIPLYGDERKALPPGRSGEARARARCKISGMCRSCRGSNFTYACAGIMITVRKPDPPHSARSRLCVRQQSRLGMRLT